MEISKHLAVRFTGEAFREVEEDVCVEEVFSLYLNDKFIASLIISPGHVKEFGAGYVICEGIASNVRDVRVSNGNIYVYADALNEFNPELRSSGCIGARSTEIRKVSPGITVEASDIPLFVRALESDAWRKTGGVHSSALFLNKKLIFSVSDIGRHSTVDKVVGYAILNNVDLSKCVLACTGRQPKGMIFKVANAGIPVIVSRAAPTDKGILAEKDAGITLVCFAMENKFNIYSHAERIRTGGL